MGLDISCGCFSGSSAAFDALRIAWSEAAGYGTIDYRGVGGPVVPAVDWTKVSTEDEFGEWPDGAPDDPLIILLVHQEREGRIKVTHCSYLADRLEELETVLLKHDKMPLVLLTQQFVRGLRYAVSNRQDVVFSPERNHGQASDLL
jgi:hypothetical protein